MLAPERMIGPVDPVPPAPERGAQQPRAGPVPPEPHRLLIVDDDEDDFLICSQMLEDATQQRFDVTWEPDGGRARAAILSGAFDVVVLDHYLGAVTGLDLLRDVRHAGSCVPIVLLTGRGNDELDEAALRTGANDYLTKETLTPELFDRTLRHAIERGRDVAALRESEVRYRTLVTSLQEGILVVDRLGRILTCNPSAERFLGLTSDELLGRDFPELPLDFVHEDGRRFGQGEHAYVQSFLTSEPYSNYIMGIRKNLGHVTWLSVNTQPLAEGGTELPTRALMSFIDVTDRVRTHQALMHRAFHDVLTGLPNRALFHDRLEQALKRAERTDEPVALAMVDLDHFKRVNDFYGHSVGDQLLVEAAQRLTALLREEDTVARMGGDEFTMILRGVSAADVPVLGERMLATFARPFETRAEAVVVPSIGFAVYPDHGSSAEQLLQRADSAMYQAKHAGRRTFRVFDPKNADAEERLSRLVSELRRALTHDEFLLHYQPQIDLPSGKIVASEALLRWQHPAAGLVLPGAFVPAAEGALLIGPIGHAALEMACRQNAAWQRDGFAGHRVAVNVSSIQFEEPSFPASVRQVLERTGLAPELLELELTETAVVSDLERAGTHMEQLKRLGVCITMDDFGTGYSSLAYLHTLPLNRVKIDRKFIQVLDTDPGRMPFVAGIAAMAEALGLEVVAEGIETRAQLGLLRELGFLQAQGYLFGRPAPADEHTAAMQRFTLKLD